MGCRDDQLFIEDIFQSIIRIMEYTENVDYETFVNNQEKIDAVVRNLKIVGEASNHISDEFKYNSPEINWSEVVGLRNILIHKYFGVDTEIVWVIIKEDIPTLKKQIAKLL